MITETTPEARLQHALDLSYRYLGFRDRTVLEVRRHLESKRVEPDTIEQTVAELSTQGYLDDARFARRFVEDRRTLDHWGNERIERKLLASGVEAELVTAALFGATESGGEPESQFDAALATLRGRYRIPPESEKDRHRALGFLVRKGYELDVAYDAIRAYGRD
ncbi:Regulatory protein RecX [Baekduia alba]|uniref:regulatory protein RecX n=1 Tax=Baekduia alba TaxID=2997333 RepID=UPI002342137C|nr:RecX family transcriptional regulator [Baekduia alba]WCB94205.1 Regulatory protein RecX [Baekduia alba]